MTNVSAVSEAILADAMETLDVQRSSKRAIVSGYLPNGTTFKIKVEAGDGFEKRINDAKLAVALKILEGAP